MSNDNQEIAEKIRNGSYFSEANNWYMGKYIYPDTERSLMLLFAIAAILALIPMIVLLNTTISADNRVPFPMKVADLTEHMPVISKLGLKDESPQDSVAKYLISDYIKAREEYIYSTMSTEKLKKLLKKIKSSSSKTVLNEYVSYMSERNPYSPLVRYKENINRYITIKNISFPDSDGKAKVVFEAVEKPNHGAETVSYWEVAMNYKLPDINVLAKSGAPLRFIVGFYKIRPLSNEEWKAVKNTEQPQDKSAGKEKEIKTEAEIPTPETEVKDKPNSDTGGAADKKEEPIVSAPAKEDASSAVSETGMNEGAVQEQNDSNTEKQGQ